MRKMILVCAILFCQVAFAKEIDSFKCVGQSAIDTSKRISITFPMPGSPPTNPPNEFYYVESDGVWHSGPNQYLLTELLESAEELTFGGLSTTWKKTGIVINVNQRDSTARFCLYRQPDPFAKSSCTFFFDVPGTSSCIVKWK